MSLSGSAPGRTMFSNWAMRSSAEGRLASMGHGRGGRFWLASRRGGQEDAPPAPPRSPRSMPTDIRPPAFLAHHKSVKVSAFTLREKLWLLAAAVLVPVAIFFQQFALDLRSQTLS